MKASYNRIFFIISGLLLILLAACGNSEETETTVEVEEVESEAQYELRLATVVNSPHTWIDASKFFAEEVENRTDGNVKVTVHNNSTLRDELQLQTFDFILGGAENVAPYVPHYQMFGFSYLFPLIEDVEHGVANDHEMIERHFSMSGFTANKLPAEYKEIIKQVALETSYFGIELGQDTDGQGLAELDEQELVDSDEQETTESKENSTEESAEQEMAAESNDQGSTSSDVQTDEQVEEEAAEEEGEQSNEQESTDQGLKQQIKAELEKRGMSMSDAEIDYYIAKYGHLAGEIDPEEALEKFRNR